MNALWVPRGGVMVIDAGLRTGPRPGDVDAGRSVVAPFLRRRGHRRIDVLVASHPHPDHIGGILTLLDQFEVGELWTAAGRDAVSGAAAVAVRDARSDVKSDAMWAELLARAAAIRHGLAAPVGAGRHQRVEGFHRRAAGQQCTDGGQQAGAAGHDGACSGVGRRQHLQPLRPGSPDGFRSPGRS